MPIGSTTVYNAGDLILHNVSSSGNTFQEVKIAAATSSIIVFNANGLLTSQSLSNTTAGTSSYFSGSSAIIGNLTASNISASGNTILNTVTASSLIATNGPLIVTGSNAYLQLFPVGGSPIPSNTTASYIYTSGSTNDLYFTQYNGPYTNTTRLRWLEGNLYTGILHGGVLSSTVGSNTFNVSSGSGMVVAINAFTGSAPYPTIKFLNWTSSTNVPITNSGSSYITYVGIDTGSNIVQQTNAWGSTDVNQWDNSIFLGVVLTLSGSVSTGVYNSPQISYAQNQQNDDFTRAFGPLKLTGHVLANSGSTLGLTKGSGTSYKMGANYLINPNHPSTVSDAAVNTSKIYRYYMSGSSPVINTGVAAAGFTVIDPSLYVRQSDYTLQSVPSGQYSIQRVFWIPNSPTNAFIVYYGNATYNSIANAVNAIATEPFVEAPNTQLNSIFVAYVVVKGNATDLSNTADASIIQAGLFRNVNSVAGSTVPVVTSLSSLSDVSASVASAVYGDLFMYDTNVWYNTKTLTGSYIISGSLNVTNNITASNISASAFSGSYYGTSSWTNQSLTASYLTTANSYTINNLTASGNISSSNTVYTNNITASNSIYLTGSSATINANGNNAAFSLALNSNQSATLTMNAQTPNVLIKSVASGNQSYLGSNSSATNIFYGYSGSSGGGGTYLNFSQNGTSKDFHVTFNNGTDLLSVNTSGYVGINVATASNATARLHISGSTASENELLIQNSGGTNLLFVSSSGKIGFGTNTPLNTLDVIGNISASSFTGSYLGTSSWANQSLTSSYLTPANNYQITNLTASNISASGTITSSGELINGNLTVTGSIFASIFSASNVYITSSQLTVTDNIITINALSPYQRYAGLEMYDSGSGTLSSFLWDSQNNYFFISSSDATASRQVILGPTGEASLTANYIPLISGSNNITSSVMYQSSSFIGVGTITPTQALDVTGFVQSSQGFYVVNSGTSLTATAIQLGNSAGKISLSSTNLSYGSGGTTTSHTFLINTTASLYINSNSNVGIGTTIPVNKLDVAGNISASTITASLFSGSFSGSHFGTSSWSSNSLTASYVTASNVFGTVTSASYALSSSYSPTNITASWSTNALTASYLTVANSYQITNLSASTITASNQIIYKNAVLLDYSSSALATSQSNYVILQNLTSSYNSAFFDYFASSGSNFRAGTLIAGWSGSNITYAEYATTDVGITNQLTMSAALSASYIQLLGNASSSLNWNIKSSGRYL